MVMLCDTSVIILLPTKLPMSSDAYSTTSLAWQTRLLWQRSREWLEYRLSLIDARLPEFSDLPEWSLPEEVAQVLFWLLAVALTAWLGLLLYRTFGPSIREWLDRDQKWVTLGRNPSTVAEDRSVQYWWQQAQALAKQGDYAAACKALYRATLQRLHDGSVLQHDASRTDGEYLTGLRGLLGEMPRPYQLLIGTHERLVYGSAIASAEMFQRCRQAYEALKNEEPKA